ncbi:MBL fold metallo-hydrolase [Amycolatopsis suaedae]|uniref:MBL fold metallo-hydrolase n=1 Tax=Amycolatopsis suaedae TaxID=2510978 RepID=A0A4Q7J6N7_9PSEU|nr:MBL fold metallo-hydrolase [Amycolatopsis suaedae]RZQ63300.1 MBL fold metallo-hydrolase [Amycolatopsis suaedae]
MKVHHLDCGPMRPHGGRLLDGQPGLLRRAELVCHCLLLETDSGLVLVETGMGTPAVHRPAEWLGARFTRLTNPVPDESRTAVAQIRALGHDPRDVRHIVLTHLDLDHAGGLVDFPDASVHVNERELRALSDPRYRPIQFEHGPRWAAHGSIGEPWFGFESVRELPGLGSQILLVPLAGHTPGHAGVAVDTGDGWLLHAGDSYFHPGELDPVRPYCPPALALFESIMQTERDQRLANQTRLRDLVAVHDEVTVFSAHNALEFRRLAMRSRV